MPGGTKDDGAGVRPRRQPHHPLRIHHNTDNSDRSDRNDRHYNNNDHTNDNNHDNDNNNHSSNNRNNHHNDNHLNNDHHHVRNSRRGRHDDAHGATANVHQIQLFELQLSQICRTDPRHGPRLPKPSSPAYSTANFGLRTGAHCFFRGGSWPPAGLL